jgi:hypothetical protein
MRTGKTYRGIDPVEGKEKQRAQIKRRETNSIGGKGKWSGLI